MAASSSDLLELDETQSKEQVSAEESSQDDIQSYKFSWYFQLFYPIYKALKFSSEFSSRCFQMLELIIFALLSPFESGDTQLEYDQDKDDVSLDPVLISLYKIWFQWQKGLRESVLYIIKLYEELVPLVPGQLPPFFAMDLDRMPLRTICFYATMHVIGRLPHHTVSFITDNSRRIRSFILKPTEETAGEL